MELFLFLNVACNSEEENWREKKKGKYNNKNVI